ncbi:Complex I intermediate-associated protein 30, mitochondrial [Terramyces sp. JEL0728]|nr:Complex I intermediate-associated protein 30, mitochondrial [Terramyces sp. JEL0728]
MVIIINSALNVKPPEYKEELLFKFNTVEEMEKWIVGSDADLGGYTEAFWGLTPQKTAKFWGKLSTRIPPGSPLEYSGYAGIRSIEKEAVMFHTPKIDSSLYRFMEVRAKGDKKQWMVNIRFVQKKQVQMDRANIKTIGFSIVKQPGEFNLEVDYIKQVNLDNTLGDMDLVPTGEQARIRLF